MFTTGGADNETEICIDGQLMSFPWSMRVVVSVTCVLAMIGSFLIILSYVLIPTIRTKAREILLNLSLMDFMVATANLVGIVTDYSNDISRHKANDPNITVELNLCVAQASFAMYGTLSSILWTICIAVYVFLRVMFEGSKVAQRSMYAFYLICYGLPLLMTVWFTAASKLGFNHYGGSGWCSLKLYDMNGPVPFNSIFGNDIWIYLTIILVPLLFLTLHFHIRYNVRMEKIYLSPGLSNTVQTVEVKLMLIPVIFIVMRVWSLALILFKVEIGLRLSCTAILLLLHIGGIGDSGQGLANAILFVFFTPKVRNFFFVKPFVCLCSCRRKHSSRVRSHESISNQYGSMSPTVAPPNGLSSATQSEASTVDERDAKSLLINAV